MQLKKLIAGFISIFFFINGLFAQEKGKNTSALIDSITLCCHESSVVCKGYEIQKRDSFEFKRVNSDSIIIKFEYIPFSDKFYSDLFSAEFTDGELIKRIIIMYTDLPGPDYTKRKSQAVLEAAMFNSFISCLVIDYLTENLDSIKDDIKREKEFEKETEKLIKEGKIFWE